MQYTADLLANLGIPYEARIITANKNTDRLQEYASNAVDRGLEIIIAGSTSKSHMREILASRTDIPVLSVPISKTEKPKKPDSSNPDQDAENPGSGINDGTGNAVNTALFAARILARKHPQIRENLNNYQRQLEQTGAPH